MTRTTYNQGKGIWVFILIITGALSLALNVWHAVDPPNPELVAAIMDGDEAQIARLLNAPEPSQPIDTGRVVLAVVVGAHPVLVAALLSHTFIRPSPRRIRVAVSVLFVVGMLLSMSAQVDLLIPVTMDIYRALMMVSLIDAPAMLSLYMMTLIDREREREREKTERALAAASTRSERPRSNDARVKRSVDRTVSARPGQIDERSNVSGERSNVSGERQKVSAQVNGERPVSAHDERSGERLSAHDERSGERLSAHDERGGERLSAHDERGGERGDERSSTHDVSAHEASDHDVSAQVSDHSDHSGMSAFDHATKILMDDPTINGAELAKLLGKSPATGRRIRAKVIGQLIDMGLLDSDPLKGERSGERSDERSPLT